MAVVHRPGEGEHIGGPSAVTIKATGEDTARSLYLGEAVAQPGFAGPPLHRHRHLHDMYVLEGVLTVRLGEDTLELEAGSFACVPPGTVHTFSNASEEPVRFLNFNTPAGWEKYMRDLGELLASRYSHARGDREGRLTLRLRGRLIDHAPCERARGPLVARRRSSV
ncbi:MAG: cupin domain-containing protein [Actinomycetota bacterium]|jgi:quercetin dioxygenase-like cupin family protein|nr:cupin domain-containing protein [Actinomycetota bacterium]